MFWGLFFNDVFYFHFIIRKNTKKVRGKLTLFFFKKKKGLSRKATKRRNANCYEQTTGPPHLPTSTPTGSKGVLITTKSKEQENKTHIVLIVFTYTKNIKTGQSECTV